MPAHRSIERLIDRVLSNPTPPNPTTPHNDTQELNGFELGDRKLVCQRANTGPRGQALPQQQMGMGDPNNPYAALMGMAGMGGLAAMGAAAALAPLPPATRVLKVRREKEARQRWVGWWVGRGALKQKVRVDIFPKTDPLPPLHTHPAS